MSKKVIIFIWLASLFTSIYSQIGYDRINIDEINPSDSCGSYYSIKQIEKIKYIAIYDTTIYILAQNIRSNILTIRTLCKNIDEIQNSEKTGIYVFKNLIFIVNNDFKVSDIKANSNIYKLDCKEEKVAKIYSNDSILYDVLLNSEFIGHKGLNDIRYDLFRYDIFTKSVVNLNIIRDPYVDPIYEYFIIEKNNSLLINTIGREEDEILCSDYFMYDINTNKLNKITNRIKDALINYFNSDYEFNNIRVFNDLMKFQQQRIYMDVNDYITPVLSGDISLLYETITLDAEIYGPVIQSDTISALLYHAKTENKESYIIPFDFNPSFEKSMGLIYKDHLLNRELLAGFDKIKLSVLKNLIFARHNYGFKNPYYSAFFNLFAFYHNPASAKSRLSDVSNLLTPADNQNLAIINEALDKIR